MKFDLLMFSYENKQGATCLRFGLDGYKAPTRHYTATQINISNGCVPKYIFSLSDISQEDIKVIPLSEDLIDIDNPVENCIDMEMKCILNEVLNTLTSRECIVIKCRYYENKTLEEVAKKFDVTRERIRQIEAKALRKLRDPKRAEKLERYASG